MNSCLITLKNSKQLACRNDLHRLVAGHRGIHAYTCNTCRGNPSHRQTKAGTCDFLSSQSMFVLPLDLLPTPFPFTVSPNTTGELTNVTLRQAPPARLLILCAPVGARQKPVQPLPPVAFFSATGWTDVFRSTFSTKASSQLSRPARKPSQCNKSQVYQKNGKFLRLETKGLEKTYCSQVMGD